MNTPKTTFDRVKDILVNESGCPEDNVTPQAGLVEHLDMDSLEVVYTVIAIEEEFNIEIVDEEASKLVTVQDIVNLVDRLIV